MCFTFAENMKHKLRWAVVLAILLSVGLIALKLTVPFAYAKSELNFPAVDYVIGLQRAGDINPSECAARYLYFNTDYHRETPKRIRVSVKNLSDTQVRIAFFDPSCQDDSVHSSVDRILLQRNGEGIVGLGIEFFLRTADEFLCHAVLVRMGHGQRPFYDFVVSGEALNIGCVTQFRTAQD